MKEKKIESKLLIKTNYAIEICNQQERKREREEL